MFSPLGRSASQGAFAHTEPTITVTTVRGGMPWPKTFLVLKNQHGSMRVSVSALGRLRLFHALGEADVELREETSTRPPRLWTR